MAEQELLQAIVEYGRAKVALKPLEDDAAIKGDKVRELMTTDSREEFEGGGFRCTYKTVTTKNIDEEKLLEKVTEAGYTPAIKTKEYVDVEELEKAIYEGKVDPSILADCVTFKESKRLTIKETV